MPARSSSASQIVFARSTCLVNAPTTGTPVSLRVGDVWAKDDPLVVARGDLFTDDPSFVHRTIPVPQEPWRIEAATRAPGETRGRRVRRRG